MKVKFFDTTSFTFRVLAASSSAFSLQALQPNMTGIIFGSQFVTILNSAMTFSGNQIPELMCDAKMGHLHSLDTEAQKFLIPQFISDSDFWTKVNADELQSYLIAETAWENLSLKKLTILQNLKDKKCLPFAISHVINAHNLSVQRTVESKKRELIGQDLFEHLTQIHISISSLLHSKDPALCKKSIELVRDNLGACEVFCVSPISHQQEFFKISRKMRNSPLEITPCAANNVAVDFAKRERSMSVNAYIQQISNLKVLESMKLLNVLIAEQEESSIVFYTLFTATKYQSSKERILMRLRQMGRMLSKIESNNKLKEQIQDPVMLELMNRHEFILQNCILRHSESVNLADLRRHALKFNQDLFQLIESLQSIQKVYAEFYRLKEGGKLAEILSAVLEL